MTMVRENEIRDLPDFDMAEMLKSEEDVATYLSLVLEDGDAAEFTHALRVVARVCGQALGVRLVALPARD